MSVKPRTLAHLKTFWTAYAVLIVSLSLTGAASFCHDQYVQNRGQARVAQAGEAAFEQVEAQLQIFLTMMKGVRALFSVNPETTPADLARYFKVLRMEDLQLDKGLEGVGIIYP